MKNSYKIQNNSAYHIKVKSKLLDSDKDIKAQGKLEEDNL